MIKQLQSSFKLGASTEKDSGMLAVSASFLTGAAIAVFFLHRCGSGCCRDLLPRSTFIIPALVIQAVILGCSVIGSFILPLCAAVYGALVCFCSAAYMQYGFSDTEGFALFLVMTPLFFLAAGEGLHYSDYVSSCVFGKYADYAGKKYIVLACTIMAFSAFVLWVTCCNK